MTKIASIIIFFVCLFGTTGIAQDIAVRFNSPVERKQYMLGLSSVTLTASNLTDIDRQISPYPYWGFVAKVPGQTKEVFFFNGALGVGLFHVGHYLSKKDSVQFTMSLNLSSLLFEIYKNDSSVIHTGLTGVRIKAEVIDWSNWRQYYSSEYTINIEPLHAADLSAFQFIVSRGINPFEFTEESYFLSKRDDATNLALIQQHPQSTFAALAKLALADQKALNASWSPDPVLKQQILQWLEQPLNSPFSHIRYLAEETKSKIKT